MLVKHFHHGTIGVDMAAIVKCERRALTRGDVLEVDRARRFQNCTVVEGEEVIVFWHDHGVEKAQAGNARSLA